MRIGVFMGHPAHYHLFKNTIQFLKGNGHDVDVLVKRKDILEKLVQEAGIDYIVVRKKERQSSSKINMIYEMLKMDWNVSKYLIKRRPSLLIGTYSPILSGYCRVPILVFNEDDADSVPRFAKLAYPRATAIITPTDCNCGKWEGKSIKYQGYQKLAYLHPKVFTPNFDIARKYLRNTNKPYVLMRFSKFNAHHDDTANGISNSLALQIIEAIGNDYDVYLTSERPLDKSLEKYRINLNPLDIHHVMAFANLYVGDSQSMSVEAAILGVPCIRFNSFVGKIKVGILDELEFKYGLLRSINSKESNELLFAIKKILSDKEIIKKQEKAKEKMLQEKINVSAFITWLVTNYPESGRQIKLNPEIQNQFK